MYRDEFANTGRNRGAAGHHRSVGRVAAALAVAWVGLVAPLFAQGEGSRWMVDSLTPLGYGNLSQGDVSMRLQTDLFEIRAFPLQEGILRLLKPDTYNSFHSLMVRKEDEIQQVADRWGLRAPTLFLVTFFGRQREARFQPDILLVTSQNRVFRPVQIFPLSPQWSQNQLRQRETQTAVYMYPDGIRLQDAIELSYDRFSTRSWAAIIRILDSEWNAVQARAARDRQ